jgi:SAM-dependent methyltransferase
MAEKGWTAVGTEFSEELVDEVADTLGVTIHQTPNLRDCQFPDDYFNAGICYHVLEHLRNPIITLDEIHRIIHPKGMLISAVPNIESFTARVSKNQWFGIDVPRHLFHFSPDTLERTLTKCGFEVTSKSSLSWEQDVFGFSQSLLNLLGFPVNIFYDLIRSPAGRIRHKFTYSNNIIGKIQIAIILFIGSILSFLGLIVAFVTSIIGSGGTLEYWSIPTRSIDE